MFHMVRSPWNMEVPEHRMRLHSPRFAESQAGEFVPGMAGSYHAAGMPLSDNERGGMTDRLAKDTPLVGAEARECET